MEIVEVKPGPSYTIRFLLLVLLPVIVLVFWFNGQYYDSDLLKLDGSKSIENITVFPDKLGSLERNGQIKKFNKNNLYEYINGHAEYYLSAGFQQLVVAEYGDDGQGGSAVVVNIYQMEKPLYAFGVLMEEAPESAEPVEIQTAEHKTLAFENSRGINFIWDTNYVQMSLFSNQYPSGTLAKELLTQLAAQNSAAAFQFNFPDFGEVVETRFIKEDYRGLEFLQQVLERRFNYNNKEFDVFLINNGSRLIEPLKQFYENEGIDFTPLMEDDLQYYRIDDPYEGQWFMVKLDEQLLGVFAPLNDFFKQKLLLFSNQMKR